MSAAPKDPLDPLYTDMVSVLKTDKNKFINTSIHVFKS